MLEKAKADEALNIGNSREQRRLYDEYIRPVLDRGRRVGAAKGSREAKL